jgi:hypothetical protein
MTLQTSGEISLGGTTAGRSVNLILGRTATASISMNDSDVRGLAGIATGAVSFSDFYGKNLSYSIVPNVTSVNEGSSVTFTVTTTGVLSGTTLFWTTNVASGTVNASDFTDAVVSGSFTINNNTATITRTLTSDVTTEGAESFQLQVRTGSTSGTVVATSSTVTINDTSVNATYAITPNVSSVNEGGSVTFTVTTTGVANGTTLFWTTNPVSGTVNTSDFTDLVITGSFTINSNTGSVIRTLRNDAITEGAESFQLQVRTGSISGTVVATSSTVTINDTSLTPPGQVLFTSSTTGYNTQTTYSWTVPAGVSSISVVCIGGGGGGRSFTASIVAGGGGGGALAYANDLFVTSGQIIDVRVGNGGQGLQTTSAIANKSGDGGSSTVALGGLIRCGANGGRGAHGTNTSTQDGFGGTVEAGEGRAGGRGGLHNSGGIGGGGGAGGYSGVGGAGGYWIGGTTSISATAGAGGAGGGGGGKRWVVAGSRAGMGGGTGVLGSGSNGAAGTTNTVSDSSMAGSGGAGSGGSGTLYGGGGGGGFNLSNVSVINGASGAVRIMWPGNLRQYPSTRTANE